MIDDAAKRVAPASVDQLTAALTQALSLCGNNIAQGDRATWILAFAADTQDIPADLLLEALANARRTCRFADEILPSVTAYVEDFPARRRARLQQLIELADVAGVEFES